VTCSEVAWHGCSFRAQTSDPEDGYGTFQAWGELVLLCMVYARCFGRYCEHTFLHLMASTFETIPVGASTIHKDPANKTVRRCSLHHLPTYPTTIAYRSPVQPYGYQSASYQSITNPRIDPSPSLILLSFLARTSSSICTTPIRLLHIHLKPPQQAC
jgi:hypothetical protein